MTVWTPVGPILGDHKGNHGMRAFRFHTQKHFRAAGSLFGNWLVAVAGTAMTESEFKNLSHPHTFEAIQTREMLLSAVVAALLGGFVYYKWKPAMAKWTWSFGACFVAWRIAVRLAPEYVIDWNPLFNESVRMFYAAMALRTGTYSLGAWLCAKLIVGERRSEVLVADLDQSR
jgi:hypothetical protein